MVEESTADLENNCFLVNNVIGRGPINIESREQLSFVQGNYGTFDAGVRCQFVHVEYTDACIPFDLDECPLDFHYIAPASESNGVIARANTSIVWRIVAVMIGVFLVH